TGSLQDSAVQNSGSQTFASTSDSADQPGPVIPPELREASRAVAPSNRLRGLFEDFEVGDEIFHQNGRTIGESEHMQLTILSRNSHPLHFDEIYSEERSIAKTRLVCGPLIFAWIRSLASRDTTANALWELNFDKGSHPAPVFARDTL